MTTRADQPKLKGSSTMIINPSEPGFYRDQGVLRLWDGKQWTGVTRPLPPPGTLKKQNTAAKRESAVQKKTKQGLVAFGALAVVVVVGMIWSGGSEDAQGIVGGLALLALYGLPIIIAVRRKHPQIAPIALINVLLGWTIIGWLGALIWSVASFAPKEVKTPMAPTEGSHQ
jgi:hypothetical protein